MSSSTINPNIINEKPGEDYTGSWGFSFMKWFFTIIIALLPILFNIISNLIHSHSISEILWDISGELLIVSIVAIAEPLFSLFNLKNKNNWSVGFLIIIVIGIIFSVFIFSMTLPKNLKEKMNSNFTSDTNSGKSSPDTSKIVSNYPKKNRDIDTTKTIDKPQQDNGTANTETTDDEGQGFQEHIIKVAFSTFGCSILLGFITLKHLRKRGD